ncbi:MAG: bifunctional phosphoribosyl-AMP cyclohydrolase/phosphoribosyl-ATP diphosphatase HisIE [Myxococcales bacterium]|nr:bifunctional phosphoribosyl-AMP cyclohydrolase/phosphoribosyl-ATP diphosphatase HisIE [Myxococcales bacterium]
MAAEVDDAALDRLWAALRPDDRGLVTAVVQHPESGRVLMVGMMSREALARTLARRRVTFWSRSRACLWEKGESSGNTLDLVDLWVDCDGDALIARAWPRGPTCHTGATTCFFRQVSEDGALAEASEGPIPAAALLDRVAALIDERKAGRGATNREGKSYVRALLDGGHGEDGRIAAKIREEAGELIEALAGDDREHIAAEAADLLFHVMVGLAARDLGIAEVREVLGRRLGVSGIDEKAARRAPG